MARLHTLVSAALFIGVLTADRAIAQEPAPEPPASAFEPSGLVPEPAAITRATIFIDRHQGKGDLTNGWYVDTGNMIPGAGWISFGPGYRHWYRKDSVFVDASVVPFSAGDFRRAQARIELPKLAKSRITLGTQLRWQDYTAGVRFFDEGPRSSEDSDGFYRLKSQQAAGYLSLRPARWLSLTGETSWLDVPEPMSQTFVTTGVSAIADGRDFPEHPTRGGLLRASATRFDDRGGDAFNFTQYEGEAAAFVPFGGRVVLALRGWAVATEDGNVPFYLQPTLGGANTLRSFANYRFRDRHAAVANAEVRLALMTHADLAFFADAGNVAPRFADLDLAKRSYGAGLRLHTRRQTYAMVDVARGDEGWRILLRLTDPLSLPRAVRRLASVPFVP